jgi:dCMP deaminase
MELLNKKWDTRFLTMSKLIASWSKDPSTQTGAVLVRPNRSVISVGYNGFAQGVQDLPERYENRELKYQIVVHCEENGILYADRQSLEGSCLYTWPFMSCSRCAAKVIQTGIKRVVSLKNDNPRWKDSFKLSTMLFDEAGVEVKLYDA